MVVLFADPVSVKGVVRNHRGNSAVDPLLYAFNAVKIEMVLNYE